MSTRKTLEQRIEDKRTKITQAENQLKELLQKQKEQDRTARNHRLCRRMGLLEKMLPDTITLTDKQFETLLKRTIANSFGRKELAEIVAENTEATTPKPTKTASQGSKPDTAPQGETPKRNGEAATSQIEQSDGSGGNVSAHGAENIDTQGF